MKQMYGVFLALLILISVSGLGSAVTITGIDNVSTTDTTPAISFTVTGNNSSYVCNLFIDSVASGVVTASNATKTTVTCNQTLASGFSGTYYITAYNSTEVPATTTSTSYSLDVSTFGGLIAIIYDVTGVFNPIVDLIVSVGTIMIALAMIGFIMGLLLGLFKTIGATFGKMGK
jgi:hypothetical protein